MCARVCVCLCVSVSEREREGEGDDNEFISKYIDTTIRLEAQIWVDECAHTYIHYKHTTIQTYVHTYTYIHTTSHTHTHKHPHTHQLHHPRKLTRACVCVYTYIVYMRVCMWGIDTITLSHSLIHSLRILNTVNVHTYIHTYIHTWYSNVYSHCTLYESMKPSLTLIYTYM